MSIARHLEGSEICRPHSGSQAEESSYEHHCHGSEKKYESSHINSYCCYLEVALINSHQISLTKASHSITLTSSKAQSCQACVPNRVMKATQGRSGPSLAVLTATPM